MSKKTGLIMHLKTLVLTIKLDSYFLIKRQITSPHIQLRYTLIVHSFLLFKINLHFNYSINKSHFLSFFSKTWTIRTLSMSSIIQFKVISGSHDDSPLCYLLQIDEYKFLLDCGWNENFDVEIIEEYKKYFTMSLSSNIFKPRDLISGMLNLLMRCSYPIRTWNT